MAKATDPRPRMNLEVLDFESAIENAFQASFAANNLDIVETQQGQFKLITPRAECQVSVGEQVQRSYFVPGTTWAYPNVWEGTLVARVITNRQKQGLKTHRMIRALCRELPQIHDVELTARMKYITIIKMRGFGTRQSFSQNEGEDISEMSYSITFNLKPAAFPTPS